MTTQDKSCAASPPIFEYPRTNRFDVHVLTRFFLNAIKLSKHKTSARYRLATTAPSRAGTLATLPLRFEGCGGIEQPPVARHLAVAYLPVVRDWHVHSLAGFSVCSLVAAKYGHSSPELVNAVVSRRGSDQSLARPSKKPVVSFTPFRIPTNEISDGPSFPIGRRRPA